MDIRRPPKWQRVTRRLASIATIAVVLLGGAGFAFQRWRDSNVPPPSGDFVDLGGRRIHYAIFGAGKYTFILEAGLGDYSASWRGLDHSLAKFGTVFVYDRAGLGWSDSSPWPRTGQQIVEDLHRCLQLVAVPKPYVLVGHSFGGLTQMLYAARFPDEVCGLLLIDPSHPRQFEVLPKPSMVWTFAMSQLAKFAPIGLPQLLMRGSDPVAMQAKHVRTAGAEFANFMSPPSLLDGPDLNLHSTPVYVLTSGALPPIPGETEEERRKIQQALFDLHEDILTMSTSPIRRHEVVAGATHYIHDTNPEVVVCFAQELIGQIENGERKRPNPKHPKGGQ